MGSEDRATGHTRRGFLRAVASATAGHAAAGFSGGLFGGMGMWVYQSVFETPSISETNYEAYARVFRPRIDPPAVFAGNGNPIGSLSGKAGVSKYLQYSSSQLVGYLSKLVGTTAERAESNMLDDFKYNHLKDNVFLGSPSANAIVAKIFGYKDVEIRINGSAHRLPMFQEETAKIRWIIDYGHEDYGVYQDGRSFALRCSNSEGKLVERPCYRLIDRLTGATIPADIEEGYLRREYLSIVRRIFGDSTTVIFSGMHGYSSEAFFSDISDNIEKLSEAIGYAREFQLVVPAQLKHVTDLTGGKRTKAELNWRHSILQEL